MCLFFVARSLLCVHADSGLLEHVFKENPDRTVDGNYVVLLYKKGKWCKVKVNDKVKPAHWQTLLFSPNNPYPARSLPRSLVRWGAGGELLVAK